MHPKVDGLFFTEDHTEMMNLAAYNVSMTKYVVPHPSLSLSSLFEYKTHQLSSAWTAALFVVGVIADMLWTDMVVCFYFTQHSSGLAAIQQSLSMPNTCRPASDCPSSTLTTTGSQTK